LPRFFLPGFAPEDYLTLTGEAAHHLGFSLRARVGETVTLPDEKGMEHIYRITGFTRDEVNLEKIESRISEGESEIRVTLFLGCAKGDKLDQMIQKSVECGAYAIVPFLSKNCVSRPEPGKKTDRWNKIAMEAAKQCGRGKIPTVSDVVSYQEAVEKASLIGGAILYEHADHPTSLYLEKVFREKGRKEMAFLIGSEGGFTPEEVEKAKAAGLASLSLGKRILRCETVPPFLMGVLMHAIGEL